MLEYKLAETAENGVSDANKEVVAKKDPYEKIKEKVKIFYGIKKLRDQARDRLNTIKQGERSANQLLVDILELWNLSEYADDQEKIKEILLRALNDQDIKLQYHISEFPDRETLTVEGIIAYANEFALHKKPTHYRANRVWRGGNRRGGRRGRGNRSRGRSGYQNNYNRRQNQKCAACGSYQHKTGDNRCFAKGKTCNKCGLKDHFAVACSTPRSAYKSGGNSNYHNNRANSNNRGGRYNYGRKQFYRNNKVDAETDNHETEKNAKKVEEEVLVPLLARGCALSN